MLQEKESQRNETTKVMADMLREFLSSATSVKDMLSNLCTFLVIQEPGSFIPCDEVLDVLQTALQAALDGGDGDVTVLAVRGAATVLEKFGRSVSKCKKATDVMKNVFKLVVPPVAVSTPEPTRKSTRKKGTESPAKAALGFQSTNQHELDEELLRCLSLTSRYSQLASSLPSSELQIAFCKSVSSSAPPMLMKASLSYMSRLLHNSIRQLTPTGLEDCSHFVCSVVDGLASTLDFSPDWDDILRAITHIALIFTRTPLQIVEAQRHVIKRAFLQLCSSALTAGKVAAPRQNLIVGCAAAICENRLQESDLGLWLPWAHRILSESVSNLLGRKIKNPYASRHNASDVSLDNDHLDSLTWKPEDARVNCLAMGCEFMAIPTQRQSRFIVAWQDDHEEFHMYPPSVSAAIVEGYFRGHDEYPLVSVSRHHKIVFSSMTQHSTQTGMQRMVHLQPIDATGSKFRITQSVMPSSRRRSDQLVQQLLPLLPTLSKLSSAACSSSAMPETVEPLAKILSLTLLTHSFGVISSPGLNVDDGMMILRGFVSHAGPSELCESCDHLIDNDARWSEYLVRCGALRSLHNYLKVLLEATTGEKPFKMHRQEETKAANNETLDQIARVRKTIHRIERASSSDITGSYTQSAERGNYPETNQRSLEEILAWANTDSLVEETMQLLLQRGGASEGELTALLSHNLTDAALQVLQTATRRSIISADVLVRSFTSVLTSELQASYPSKSKLLQDSIASSSTSVGICLSKVPKLFCPGGHALRIHHSAVWTCDECRVHRMTASLSCRSCNYDLCTLCVARRNPNIVDVSYAATVGEILRYLQGERSATLGAGAHRAAVLTIVEALTGVRPAERPPTNTEPRLEMVPIASPLLFSNSGMISAGTTLLQLVGDDHHCRSEVVPLHLRSDHDTPCKCLSFQSPRLPHSRTPSATPKMSPLPVAPGADVTFQSAAIRLLEDVDVPLSPSPAVDQMVIDIVELFATDIFLKGVDGIPKVLRELLSSRCRRCVSVGVRQDVMRFCAAENRRYALLHMFAEGMRTRGSVRVELQSNGLATKFAVPRGVGLIAGVDAAFGTFPTLRNKVEFTFVGEEGTGEGPTQEVYTEISHILCARKELWHATEFGVILFPSALARHDEAFRVLGAAFARSFVDGYTMDISVSPLLWEYVSKFHGSLDASNPVSRIEYVALCLDPLWQRSVTSLRLVDDDEAMAELGIYFDPEGCDEECREVTIDNREEYIVSQLRKKFGQCERNAYCFAEGLARVVDLAITTMLDPQEADGVFCGHNTGDGQPLFTEDDLKAHVVGAHGYTSESPEVSMLVSIVASLTPQEQSHFVEFITGSPRLPLGGLAGLGRKITVVKKELECGERTLPSCNTCFLYFKLPPYSKREVMRERMLMAITEGRRNFSLS